MRSGRPLLIAILASIVLHTMALVLVHIPEGQAVVDESPIEVALVPPQAALPPSVAPPQAAAAPAPQRPQMVAPPDVINDRPPDNPRFESDRDNTVLKETVSPGVPHPGEPAPAQAPRPPSKGDTSRERQRAEA